jgi:glycosyltransferase involved in cell wall biosynthesis
MGALRVLIVAPSLDGTDIGEVEWAFKWTEALSRRAEVTVLATSRIGLPPLAAQLPKARVVTWPEPAFLYQKFERFNAIAKPALPLFARQVRRWIRTAHAKGEHFDIAHQILPQAMRHATPLRGMGIPYVVGPIGGGLNTPEQFRAEVLGNSSLASRLRALDRFRHRYDPWLRGGYAGADLIFGVAPYVAERLVEVGLGKVPFQAILERGHGGAEPEARRQDAVGRLRLLHVGRTVRTKGLRDTIRAMADLRDLPEVTLVSAGGGEDLANCRAEADRLGLSDRITFLGRIPRADVEGEYARADVFCFPSFREPMGGVLFEAMAHGLPIVTAARGGPDAIVDDTCGIRVPVSEPGQFAHDIAGAIRRLALDPSLRLEMGRSARARLLSFGSWEERADDVMAAYHRVLETREARPA